MEHNINQEWAEKNMRVLSTEELNFLNKFRRILGLKDLEEGTRWLYVGQAVRSGKSRLLYKLMKDRILAYKAQEKNQKVAHKKDRKKKESKR